MRMFADDLSSNQSASVSSWSSKSGVLPTPQNGLLFPSDSDEIEVFEHDIAIMSKDGDSLETGLTKSTDDDRARDRRVTRLIESTGKYEVFLVDKQQQRSWRALRFNSPAFWVCVVVFAGLIVVGISVLVSNKEISSEKRQVDNIFAGQIGDPNLMRPTETSNQSALKPAYTRFEVLQQLLSSESSSKDLSDPTSDQYMAMKWLAEADPAEIDFEATSHQEIKDRYRAAVISFALNKGREWRYNHGFLSAEHICNWNDGGKGYAFEGIRCEKGEVVEITLSMNRLSGTIPKEIASFNLHILDLGSNSISGTIPSELGQLTNLKSLKLGSNELVGELPSELGDLLSLQTLLLFGNANVEGAVPSSYRSLVKLEHLYIEGTNISGEVDSTFCNRKDNFKSFYANCGPDGGLTCSCCTYCCNSDGASCRGVV